MRGDPEYGAWRGFEDGCRCHNNPPCAFCASLVDREIEVMDAQPTREKAMAALAEMVNPMDLADENYCAICGSRISRAGAEWAHLGEPRDHRAYAGEKFNGSSIVELFDGHETWEAFVPDGLLGEAQTRMKAEFYPSDGCEHKNVTVVENGVFCDGCGEELQKQDGVPLFVNLKPSMKLEYSIDPDPIRIRMPNADAAAFPAPTRSLGEVGGQRIETAHCVGCGEMILRDVWPHHSGPWHHDFCAPPIDAHAAVPVEGSIIAEPPVPPLDAISLGARQPGAVGYDRPEPPGVDLLGDLRVIAEQGFITPDRTELHVQKKKNGDVVFIVVERETPETTRSHRATLALGQQKKLLNLMSVSSAEKPETAPVDPPPSYDMSIHSNPDARAWAKFFVETIREVSNRNIHPAVDELLTAAEISRLVCDESYMVGWFANAMMAMHDHMGSRPPVRPSVDEIFAGLTDEDFEPDFESQKDWEIPGWMWAIFISGVLITCTMIFVAIRKGAL